jgi:hypothetical protein
MSVAPAPKEVTPSTAEMPTTAGMPATVKKELGKGRQKQTIRQQQLLCQQHQGTPATKGNQATETPGINGSKNIGISGVRGNSRPILTAAIDLSTIAGNPAT